MLRFVRLSRWMLVFLLTPPIPRLHSSLALPKQPLVAQLLELRQAELAHKPSVEAPISLPGDHKVIVPDHGNPILGHLQYCCA